MRNFIKDTWLAGLMLFSSLLGKKNSSKTIEVNAEDYHSDTNQITETETGTNTKNEEKNV